MFRQDFTCPALLESCMSSVLVRGCHPLYAGHSRPFQLNSHTGTGLIRVRSPLLTESR